MDICDVPVAQPKVEGDKSVKSIEEILQDINNDLLATKNSGELMKSIRSKEFLDSSQFKIKMHQIVSFDLNSSQKPLYDTNPDQQAADSKDSADEAQKERARENSYPTDDKTISTQKNKYLLLRNPAAEAQGIMTTGTRAPSTDQSSADLAANLAKALNNAILDSIGTFIKQNGTFWKTTDDKLTIIRSSSESLKKKIDKGD